MRSLLTSITLGFAFGCADPTIPPTVLYGSPPPDAGGCVLTTLPIASDDPVLGYSVDDILAFSEGVFSSSLVWFDDETTLPLDIEITYAGGALELIDSEPSPSGTQQSNDLVSLNCKDSLSIEVELTLRTADDSFNEALVVRLSADRATQALFSTSFEGANSWSGTYLFDQANPSTYDTFTLKISGGMYRDQAPRGHIGAQGQFDSGSTSFVDGYEIAGWPSEEYL